jgi:hypothetical protein
MSEMTCDEGGSLDLHTYSTGTLPGILLRFVPKPSHLVFATVLVLKVVLAYSSTVATLWHLVVCPLFFEAFSSSVRYISCSESRINNFAASRPVSGFEAVPAKMT